MNTELDITADLVDGSDGALGDPVPANAGSSDSVSTVPDGTVNANERTGDVIKQGSEVKPDKPATLRDTLSNAFKETPGEAEGQAGKSTPTTSSPPALTQDADGKYRNIDGTFASAAEIEAFQAAQAAPVQELNTQDNLLQGMTALEQEQFKSLPAELQQLVGRTMEDLNARQSRYAEYDILEQMIGPRRQPWMDNGMTPAVALNQLFALSDFASRDPGRFVLWYADTNQIDLDALLDQRDAEQANVDPVMAELQELRQLITGSQQQNVQDAQTQRLQTVQTFAQEKDGAGALKRPYLGEVTQQWAAQITAIRAMDPNMPDLEVLQKAYDNACMLDPNVRGKIQAANTARHKADTARVAQAKAAASSTNGSAPVVNTAGSAANENLSVRANIEQAFAEYG